jgi:putative ATPase
VPSHLRDANRDGKAFGDGVGYRYPHAYAEHWVAQQYLPTALQGEVFWQPGSLGWEGALRPRLQQRRAAQLAAAAETALDQPDLLSSSPDDPQLERWLRRQAAAEGERLEALRMRFWQAGLPGRLDRVLVLDARSLLWALDPLQQALEGEVVIGVADAAERERLEAQLQILDQLQRPRLLVLPPDAPEQLAQQLGELPHGGRFEWLVGRQPFRGQGAATIETWLDGLEPWLTPKAEVRLLFSRPQLGPAGSLHQWLRGRRGQAESGEGSDEYGEATLLEREQNWLSDQHQDGGLVAEGLRRRGWSVQEENWQENLSLTLREALLERWFASGAPYRRWLEPQLGVAAIQALRERFQGALGASLPQPLEHTLVRAHRQQEAQERAPRPADKKKPRADRGRQRKG